MTGMLWLDDDKKRPFTEKVQRAAQYYREKYGLTPNICLVNPNQLAEEQCVGGIAVKPARNVLMHHFFIGVEEAA